MPEAAKHLGVKYNNFTGALYRGGLVKGRYQIIKKGFFLSKELIKELEIPEKQLTYAEKFKEEWKAACTSVCEKYDPKTLKNMIIKPERISK